MRTKYYFNRNSKFINVERKWAGSDPVTKYCPELLQRSWKSRTPNYVWRIVAYLRISESNIRTENSRIQISESANLTPNSGKIGRSVKQIDEKRSVYPFVFWTFLHLCISLLGYSNFLFYLPSLFKFINTSKGTKITLTFVVSFYC